jgi:hypothetical protein
MYIPVAPVLRFVNVIELNASPGPGSNGPGDGR